MKLVLGAIAKNEAPYLAEWLIHHARIGFDEIAVYDNESTDSTADVLDFFAGRLPVRHRQWETRPGKSPQISAYNDLLERYRAPDVWIAFFDLDEFLIPTGGSALKAAIAGCAARQATAIGVNQRVFGASGAEAREDRPVIDRFRRCARPSSGEAHWVKSIYCAARIEAITGVHASRMAAGTHLHPNGEAIDFPDPSQFGKARVIDYSLLQLNHYITKSREEFLEKRARGGAASVDPAIRRGLSMLRTNSSEVLAENSPLRLASMPRR